MSRIFIDLDGTLFLWMVGTPFHELYRDGYFETLPPNQNMLALARYLMRRTEDEVYTLSTVLADKTTAVAEKNRALDKHLPEIDSMHRIFVTSGTPKSLAVPGGIRPSGILLDDYTKNLAEWATYAKAVKVLNGINHTNRTWTGASIAMPQDDRYVSNALLLAAINTIYHIKKEN